MGLRPLTRLAGLRSEISISRSRLHSSLSPLGRGPGEGLQGEGLQGEGLQGEGLQGEGLQGEGLQGEGSWTLDWTLSQ